LDKNIGAQDGYLTHLEPSLGFTISQKFVLFIVGYDTAYPNECQVASEGIGEISEGTGIISEGIGDISEGTGNYGFSSLRKIFSSLRKIFRAYRAGVRIEEETITSILVLRPPKITPRKEPSSRQSSNLPNKVLDS
jgi:hypothetical protein